MTDIITGNRAKAADFIYKSQANVVPSVDQGRVAKLEADGRIDEQFLRQATLLTANEDIAITEPAGIALDGKLARAVRAWANDGTNTPATMNIVEVLEVNTNKFVAVYGTGGQNYSAVVFTIDASLNKITFGTAISLTTIATGKTGACKLDTDKFVFTWVANGSSDPFATVATISGTTISLGTDTVLGAASLQGCVCAPVNTNRFAFYAYHSTSALVLHGFCTVSGTTPTVVASTATAVTGFAGSTNDVAMCKIATDKVAVLNGGASSTNALFIATTVSTTYTVGAGVGNLAPSPVMSPSLASTATDTGFLRVGGKTQYFTVSGTVPTLSGSVTGIADVTGSSMFVFNSEVYEIHINTTTALCGLYKISQSAGVTTRRQLQSFVPTIAKGAGDATRFAIIGTNGTFNLYGMADNLAGYIDAAVSSGAATRVNYNGVKTGLSNIIAGLRYSVSGNAYTPDITGRIIGLTSSSVLYT